MSNQQSGLFFCDVRSSNSNLTYIMHCPYQTHGDINGQICYSVKRRQNFTGESRFIPLEHPHGSPLIRTP